eukprot:CAMPEP_0183728602 /NCGR_PEP_ID=MMETSP0737-20130205/28443_1 /TAXON_ID=385413 /ORGANISM="Thalassiosira miniscula, Strain CCMP1093" /LENGTH=667 /DNA_ID=CAMNT_0025960595 /DNA_START=29 /DNA_END=2032 /DNA_ORIENTATION=+
MATMNSSSKHLKLRRHAPSAANPQDLDDVECGKELYSLDYDEGDADHHDKKDDDCVLSRRSADFLSDLSPLSRRIVRFVTPAHPSLPDRCTSECLTVAAMKIVPSLAVMVALPLLIWDGYPEDWGLLNLYPLIRHIDIVWSSLLHMSALPIMAATFVAAALMPRGGIGSKYLPQPKGISSAERLFANMSALASNVTQSSWKIAVALSLILSGVCICNMGLQMGYPHALWNPFIWGWYHVYLPQNISPALKGACLDFEMSSASRQPLCLSEREWNELSSGQLSSYNPDDVLAVQKGLDYLQNQSGGLIINALARNVADSIPAFRQNIEGLVPFFKDPKNKLSIVIFENDSDDGTRQEFQSWAAQEAQRQNPRYTVDLMSCGPKNPNCELGLVDRYNVNLLTNPKASGVGKLGEFRQIVLEYIMGEEKYKDYSHMIILDVDLGTSLSPLGLLHTLGLENGVAQDRVVASSSSQIWPGTSGSILPPYDLSAFRPKETKSNSKLRQMHQSFCELMPAGDRWRNLCEAASPMQLFMIQSAGDVISHHGRAYEVVSAFNGLTVYPMKLIRERGDQARYDAGDDGQRCEHVGFHISLGKTMYVNPKWSMNLKPEKPGGPTGFKAIKTLATAIIGRPNVMASVAIGNFLFFYIMVYACWRIATGFKLILSLQNHR